MFPSRDAQPGDGEPAAERAAVATLERPRTLTEFQAKVLIPTPRLAEPVVDHPVVDRTETDEDSGFSWFAHAVDWNPVDETQAGEVEEEAQGTEDPAPATLGTPAVEALAAQTSPLAQVLTRPERRNLRRPVLVGAAALTCVLTAGAGTTAALTKTVSLVVDGQQREVSTMSGTVAGALASAGVNVGDHDSLAPSESAGITDGSTIVVNRGRKLSLTIDGKQQVVWTTARTVDEAMAQLGLGTDGELRLSASRSREIPLDGLAVSGTTMVAVKVAVGGGVAESVTSTGETVSEVLADSGITVGPLDLVHPAPATPSLNGMTITVDRVVQSDRTETRPVKQPADKTVADATMEQGESRIVQAGSAGTVSVTVAVRSVNGEIVSEQDVKVVPGLAAKPRIIHIGTMAPDPAGPVAAAAAEKNFTYQGDQVFTHDTTFGVNWDGLAFCESTHNPRAVNANPSAGLPTYGLFQFDIPTWATVGGSGNPMDASPSEQLMRAKKLYQQRGLEPWACAYAAH